MQAMHHLFPTLVISISSVLYLLSYNISIPPASHLVVEHLSFVDQYRKDRAFFMDNQGQQGTPDQNIGSTQTPTPATTGSQTAPYEVPLTKAFDKLTSEIFLFLLAYVILLIGLAVFGSSLIVPLRTLLYIVPILGVAAYLWQQQGTIVKDGKNQGIDVKAGKVLDDAHVSGVINASREGAIPSNVKVRVKKASGRARVSGAEYADGNASDNKTGNTLQVFQQLSSQNQMELIKHAQEMLSQQEDSHG